jgi:hypothetical protein
MTDTPGEKTLHAYRNGPGQPPGGIVVVVEVVVLELVVEVEEVVVLSEHRQ